MGFILFLYIFSCFYFIRKKTENVLMFINSLENNPSHDGINNKFLWKIMIFFKIFNEKSNAVLCFTNFCVWVIEGTRFSCLLLHSTCCSTLFWLKYMKKICPDAYTLANEGKYFLGFSDSYWYWFSLLYQNSSNNFLKVSYNLKSELFIALCTWKE
jgi:hypothetical protein